MQKIDILKFPMNVISNPSNYLTPTTPYLLLKVLVILLLELEFSTLMSMADI